MPDESRVWVDARSSVHKIHSTADGLEGFLDLATPPAGRVSLPVRRLTTGNPLEDRELQRFADVGRYPTIDGVLTEMKAMDDAQYRIFGDLTLKGVTRPCDGVVKITPVDDRTIRLAGESMFDIREFGLEPPRILMLRVEPAVSVRIELVARILDS